MKKCWNSNLNERPDATEIMKSINSFINNKQFKKAEDYRKTKFKNNQSTIHPQAVYTSRLLNPYTESLKMDFIK